MMSTSYIPVDFQVNKFFDIRKNFAEDKQRRALSAAWLYQVVKAWMCG